MLFSRKKNGHDGNDVSARLNAIRSELDALQKNILGLLDDVKGTAGEQVQGAVKNASLSAKGAVDCANAWGNESLDGMRETVRGRPLAVCALSIGAGALLGALLLRR